MDVQEFVEIDQPHFNKNMANWVRANRHIMRAMSDYSRLIVMNGPIIRVNLNYFNPQYQYKFIDHNFEHYCEKFIDRLDEPISIYLKTNAFAGYEVTFIFLLNGKIYEKFITYKV